MGWRELKAASPARPEDLSALRSQVSAVLQAVQRDGDAALRNFAKTFDGYEGQIRVGPEEVERVKRELPPDVIRGLDFAIERVTAFAQAQFESLSEFEREMIPGVFMGQRLVPVDSAGTYVPARHPGSKSRRRRFSPSCRGWPD